MKKIRLIIIEDNQLFREGISLMINDQEDIHLLAALGDRIKVHEKIMDLKPDLLLLDLGLVNQNSLELVKNLKKKFPKLKIIAMDLLPNKHEILQFIEAGVSGFILKDATPEDFMNTIRSVSKGDKIYPSQMQGSLISEIVDKAVNELMSSKLIESIRMTENEKKIITLISEGFTDKEAAKKLNLTISKIRSHIDNILEKMALGTHVQIAVYRDSTGEDSFNTYEVKDKKANILKKHRTKFQVILNSDGTYNGRNN